MSKTHLSEAFNMLRQIVPFLMITALLIVVTYTYGHAIKPSCSDTSFDFSKTNFMSYN